MLIRFLFGPFLRRRFGRPMTYTSHGHGEDDHMGKRDELRRQIEALQKQHDESPDDDDDDLEIDVEKDGHKVRVRGRHARKVMRRLGLDDDDQGAAAGEGGEGEEGEGEEGDGQAGADPKAKAGAKKDPEPRSGHRYFK